MPRKNKSSHRSRGSSKNPQQPPPSDERPPPARKTKPPLRLLPPLLEKQWTAEEIWALMAQTERSYSMDKFSDTPEYWNSIAPYFPGSSAESLRKMHLSIVFLQSIIVPWRKDEVLTLVANVYGYIEEPVDTPQWWGEIASNLPRRTALDCRVAYHTYGLSRWLSQPRQHEISQLVVPSSTIDAVITPSERTSIEPSKSEDKEKEQQEEMAGEPLVTNNIMDTDATLTQRTLEVAAETKSKGKKKKKKKKKQHEETMEASVPSNAIDAGCTSTNQTSEVALMALSKGKEKQQPEQEETWQHVFANSTTFPGETSSQTPEEFSKTTSNDNEELPQQEEIRHHSFESSTKFLCGASSNETPEELSMTTFKDKEKLQQQEETRSHTFLEATDTFKKTSKDIPKTMSKDKEKPQQKVLDEMQQHTFTSGTTFLGGTSSQRSFVEPLKNWKLEDYVFLMKTLTLNLHVDTDNDPKMEIIASWVGGKTADEVRYLILKWRPQLLAALEKADRITGSSSGTKDLETSNSKKNDDT